MGADAVEEDGGVVVTDADRILDPQAAKQSGAAMAAAATKRRVDEGQIISSRAIYGRVILANRA